MKYVFLLIISFPIFSFSQTLENVTDLNETVKETSGLIYLNQKFITHNDSGGKPALYEIDTISGMVTRKVIVSNAKNKDWEAICKDSEYIYIGDFGNNKGSREKLRIYRLLIADYLDTPNDTVSVDTINFNYSEQTDFTSRSHKHNFDAEALIAYEDSLYLFTKNWLNFKTNIYAIPKTPGNYEITSRDSIDIGGLITGADYNPLTNTIVLSGYTDVPFVVKIEKFPNNVFSGGKITRRSLGFTGSFQTESIASIDSSHYFITAEKDSTNPPTLYSLDIDSITPVRESIQNTSPILFPNPTTNFVNIQFDDFSFVEIYDLRGILRMSSEKKQINLSNLEGGQYFVIIHALEREKVVVRKLLIK